MTLPVAVELCAYCIQPLGEQIQFVNSKGLHPECVDSYKEYLGEFGKEEKNGEEEDRDALELLRRSAT